MIHLIYCGVIAVLFFSWLRQRKNIALLHRAIKELQKMLLNHEVKDLLN